MSFLCQEKTTQADKNLPTKNSTPNKNITWQVRSHTAFSSVTGLFRASVRIWFWPRVSDSSVHIWFWPHVSDSSVHIWFWPRVSDGSGHAFLIPVSASGSGHAFLIPVSTSGSGHAFLIPVSASGPGHAFMTAAVLQYSLRLGSLTIAALSFFPTRFWLFAVFCVSTETVHFSF